eukprot:c25237_g1_i1.p1 GENE.c25237_g1_i1~~c25237_g1_i1.p1  ORF type:complete len:119 (-),score=7.83 c25237_g1_i1:17-373(-)
MGIPRMSRFLAVAIVFACCLQVSSKSISTELKEIAQDAQDIADRTDDAHLRGQMEAILTLEQVAFQSLEEVDACGQGDRFGWKCCCSKTDKTDCGCQYNCVPEMQKRVKAKVCHPLKK